MTILVADEHLHPTQPLPHWQESFYFNWTDLQAGAFGLTRIGYRLDSGEADAVVITMRGGKRELVYAAQNQTVPTTPGEFDTSRGLKVDRLTYTCEEPLKRWRLVLEGRDSFDLSWTALADRSGSTADPESSRQPIDRLSTRLDAERGRTFERDTWTTNRSPMPWRTTSPR
ncbi:hypothetical protein [Janibacter sp. G1551]|uniref:hypothetical protein n=1 Tax=Janibacter sp. G1551 TaxID=3420440 RepID=UPI003D022A61